MPAIVVHLCYIVETTVLGASKSAGLALMYGQGRKAWSATGEDSPVRLLQVLGKNVQSVVDHLKKQNASIRVKDSESGTEVAELKHDPKTKRK